VEAVTAHPAAQAALRDEKNRTLRRAIGRRVPLPTEVTDLTLAELGPPMFAVVVYGTPAPQGSKTPTGRTRTSKNGKKVPILRESSRAVKPWREAVAAAALAALPPGWTPLTGPLVADYVLTLPKPADRPKTLRTLPDRQPDLSKLLRATEDGIDQNVKSHGRQVILDDAQFVGFRRLFEFYVGDPDPDALRQPGAVIRIWPYPRHLLGKVSM